MKTEHNVRTFNLDLTAEQIRDCVKEYNEVPPGSYMVSFQPIVKRIDPFERQLKVDIISAELGEALQDVINKFKTDHSIKDDKCS